jgi:hypothetical protein
VAGHSFLIRINDYGLAVAYAAILSESVESLIVQVQSQIVSARWRIGAASPARIKGVQTPPRLDGGACLYR